MENVSASRACAIMLYSVVICVGGSVPNLPPITRRMPGLTAVHATTMTRSGALNQGMLQPRH